VVLFRRVELFSRQSKRVGYLWLDAHGDMNTPESSPWATFTACRSRRSSARRAGAGRIARFTSRSRPRNVALWVRDLDSKERRLIKDRVHVFTIAISMERGMRDVMMRRCVSLPTIPTARPKLTWDFVDPTTLREWHTSSGVTYAEAHLGFEMTRTASDGVA